MTPRPDPRMKRLADMAERVRSARLARLSAACARRDAQIALLAGLDIPPVDGQDAATLLATDRHRIWAEARKSALHHAIREEEKVIGQERRAASVALARCLAFERVLKR